MEKHHEHLNCIEIWDAIQNAFFNLTLEEVAELNNISIKAIYLGEGYMLIRVDRDGTEETREVEIISVSGHVNHVMKIVMEMAYEDEIDCWKEKKGKKTSWCFKVHWDEEE